jgi:hypothetical protein
MDRGPMALFAALVAVGLGPAMWLGAQFGSAVETPSRPPVVTSEQNLENGGGAGSAPEDPGDGTKPRGSTKPRVPSSADPSASATETPDPDESIGGPPATTTASPSKPTPPPAEPTTEPDDPPGGGNDPGPPPSPPPSDQGVEIDLPVL